ncbi:MAG: magnesium transporter CorA family protein [Legionellaceae bacterium]|nr:magnesium transporter CorA family protein [Legionellaceae bacterium]
MLTYLTADMSKPETITAENQLLLRDAIWIDLFFPSKEEENAVETLLGFVIPTRADMAEIELSSRLYTENHILFMTGAMIAQSESDNPLLDPVTFILTKQRLITIRYVEPQSFRLFPAQIQKLDHSHRNALSLMIDLLDTTIDRLADILELLGHRIDNYSKRIFPSQNNPEKIDYQLHMRELGANGDLNTKAQESLVTFNRLIAFLSQTSESTCDKNQQLRLTALGKDIMSLTDHAHFLSTKTNFLLDATLGLVNIEQNNIIKIFSVAAVIFLPPTLIASIYGMNFHFIPEMSWKYGYIYAVGLMALAAWLPYRYFKYRKWL